MRSTTALGAIFGDDHRSRMGRPVRRRRVRAAPDRLVPLDDDSLRRRGRAAARGARLAGGASGLPARGPRPAALRPRHARLRRLQPSRVHGARACAPAERVAHRRARPARHRARALAADARQAGRIDVRAARGRADGCRARDQRRASDHDRQRLDRVGRCTRARRRRELRALRPRRSAHAGALAASLHRADGSARLAFDRSCNDRRDRRRLRAASVRERRAGPSRRRSSTSRCRAP